MPTKSHEDIRQMAKEALEKDERLRRALDVFQLGQKEFLKALTATNSVHIFTDDNTVSDQTDKKGKNEKLD